MTYPTGAIKTTEELRRLGSTATLSNPVYFYSVSPIWEKVGRVIICPGEVRRDYKHLVTIIPNVSGISVDYFNLDGWHDEPNFIFSNYWFAWAYYVQLKQGIVKQGCAAA